ncbi:hypothetical protein, partial [uncultured Akkermansia sp.]|uniref:hypothetical protein n=1 Tax=uncultured Akkermansia sp. TaxID=512294 RepID=UPI002618B214
SITLDAVPAWRRGRGGLYRHFFRNARKEIIFSCMHISSAGGKGLNKWSDLKSADDVNKPK